MLVEDMLRNKWFFQARISHVLCFISICDLLTNSPLYSILFQPYMAICIPYIVTCSTAFTSCELGTNLNQIKGSWNVDYNMFKTAVESNPSPTASTHQQGTPHWQHHNCTKIYILWQSHHCQEHTKDTKQRLQLLSTEILNIFFTNFFNFLNSQVSIN
jgi:hypothetical protein